MGDKLKAAQEGQRFAAGQLDDRLRRRARRRQQHIHDDLPTLIAGHGGNFIKTGRRVVYRKETPMCNLFLTMMDRMGTKMDHFGDATGHLNGLDLT